MRGFLVLSTLIIFSLALTVHAWEIDFSRRRSPASAEPPRELPEKTVKTETLEDESLTRPSHEQTEMNMPPVAQPKGMDLPLPLRKLVATKATRRVVDRQAFVILNTDKGFIPSNIRIFKGGHYLVHVVNVNEDKKNVSFVLDDFHEHHSTYFGKIKSFELSPDQEGVFEFQCPETSAQGRLVVLGNKTMSPVNRKLSSSEKAPHTEEPAKQEEH